jgi:hypothetical protein
VITSLLVLVLGQLPPTVPPLGTPPFTIPPSASFRVPFIGTPGMAWNGTDYVVVWKDQRRTPSGGGPAMLFVTTYDGGASALFPQGRPLLSGIPATINPEPLAVVSNASNTFVGYVVPSPDGGSALIIRATTDGGVYGAWSTNLPSLSRSRLAQFPALAASADALLAAWYSDGVIHLNRWPGDAGAAIDAGPNVSSLSVGHVAGGFLVGWVSGSNATRAALYDEVLLTPLAEHPLGTTFTKIQVVSAPQVRQVLATEPAALSHLFFNGMGWSNVGTFSGVETLEFSAVGATPTGQLFTYSASMSRRVLAAPLFAPNMYGPAMSVVPTTHKTLAMATNGQDGMLLTTFDGELFGQRLEVATAATPSVSPQPPVVLLRAPALQRFPSAVWSASDDRFLVAWDESQPDASFRVLTTSLDLDGGLGNPTPLFGAPVTSQGSQPVLLSSPDGGTLAVQLGSSPGARQVYSLSRPMAAVGMSLTPPPAPFSGALLGDRVALQWGSSSSSAIVRANSEGMPRVDRPGLAPTCGALVGQDFWLPVVVDGGILFAQVNDGLGSTTLAFDQSAAPESPVCAARTGPGALTLAWRTPVSVMVMGTLVPLIGPVRSRGSFSDTSPSNPRVVPIASGTLVTWLSDSQVRAVALTDAGSAGPFTLGTGEVANLSVASSPAGVALVLWDAFDADAGARRVEFRLVDRLVNLQPADGGMGFDASVPGQDGGGSDGGVVDDGGVIDAGVIGDGGVIDAGVVGDGGVVDGGAFDGGTFDGGGAFDPDGGVERPSLSFVPACGCGSTSLEPLLLGVLLALARRRGREGARPRFR